MGVLTNVTSCICAGFLLLVGASPALAQSHELTIRFVEITPAAATQPSIAIPPGPANGNVGTALPVESIVGQTREANTTREIKLGVDLDRPFSAEFKRGDLAWKFAGSLRAASTNDALLRVSIDGQYSEAGGLESFSSNTIVPLAKDSTIGGLSGPRSVCWIVRVDRRQGRE